MSLEYFHTHNQLRDLEEEENFLSFTARALQNFKRFELA